MTKLPRVAIGALLMAAANLLLSPVAFSQSYNTTAQTEQQGTSTSAMNPRVRSTQASGQDYQTDSSGYPDRPSATEPSAEATASYKPERIDSPRTDDHTAADRDDQRSRTTRERPRPAEPSEFEKFVSRLVDQPIRRFGANLLVPSGNDFIVPPTTAIPPDYLINPGDEIIVGLTGSVQVANLNLRVNADGQIFIPTVGAVMVGGTRFGDLHNTIARQIAKQYRNFEVTATIGRLHGITVYVTGFAATPGSYTLSSLSTLVNAVLAAGGPASGGSFRSIQVRRGGKLVTDFDLYDFLLKGDKRSDVALRNQDVIYFAPAGAQVAVVGSVNNQAIYEARASDTLEDMLLYAGGVSTAGDTSRLLVLDPMATAGWQSLEPGSIRSQVARRSQVLRVLSGVDIAKPLGTQSAVVTVAGEVAKPGRYFVPPGTPLSSVIAQAGGLTGDAFVYGTVFTREQLRRDQRRQFNNALEDMRASLSLQQLTNVRQTGDLSSKLLMIDRLSSVISDRGTEGRLILNTVYPSSQLPSDLIVENNDQVYIPPRPVTVSVYGLVGSPSSFRYREGDSVADLIKRAGGPLRFADRSKAIVFHANGSVSRASEGSVLNRRVLPGDVVFIPVKPNRGEFWQKAGDALKLVSDGVLGIAAAAYLFK